MAITTTPRHGFPRGDLADNGWNDEMNALAAKADALLQSSVISMALTAPPGGESEGDLYVVASGATGSWSGQDLKVPQFIDAGYTFYAPFAGLRVWNQDDLTLYVYSDHETNPAWYALAGPI